MQEIDFQEVWWFAQRAAAVYRHGDRIRESLPEVAHIATLPDFDVRYFHEHCAASELQVVSVRGTASFRNVWEDLAYLQSRDRDLDFHAHHGFHEASLRIFDDLAPRLSRDREVRVTGHSLGAAVAALLMVYLHEGGFQVGRSINFGQPKVTNRAGAERYASLPLVRVVDEDDLVPLVPPTTLLDSVHGIYDHFGEEVLLLEGEHYTCLEQHDPARRSADSFWRHIAHVSIEEHFMKHYLSNIRGKLDKAVAVPFDRRRRYLP